MALPHCDELFVRYFLPWHSDEDRDRRAYTATRPDLEELQVQADRTASDLSPLTPDSQLDAAQRVNEMFEAAAQDWKKMLGVRGMPSTDWVQELDRHYKTRQIEQLIKRSDPSQYDNDYFVLCCELGAVLGTILQSQEPRLAWLYDWPYWESALYDQRTRSRINVFHWAIKKMSGYGMDDGLTDKLAACRRGLNAV